MAVAATLAAGLVFVLAATSASLPGSNFEIDDPGGAVGANLIVNGPAPALDWANVAQLQQQDQPTGQNDDSYSGGSKEDDPCPAAGTGSIPNNKSDLTFFGGYKEDGPTAGHPGFLHVFWSRVQDPSGTTNLDFEFNKLATDCDGAGPAVNVTRSVGDILLQFDVDRGGAVAHLSRRNWTGTAWSDPPVPLSATQAIGSINQVAIPAGQADGLGALTPRTFGEASFDLSQAFDPGTCQSFGSAMLKSRSSDSFTSQLKDFIVPINVNINNCGQVIIRKQTDPQGETQLFDYDKSFGTFPATSNEFQLADDGVQDYGKTVLFGSGYTVAEDLTTLAPGWEFVNVDCSASSNVTPQINGAVVTFDINSDDDVLDCTYNNRLQQGSIKVLKTSIKGNTPLAGAVFSVSGQPNLVTDANGEACVDGLDFGQYTVTEVAAPGGYAIDNPNPVVVTVGVNSECPAGDPASTLSFSDTPLTDITATANSQDDGPGGTLSTITCVDGNGQNVGNSPQGNTHDPAVAANNLHPGTYTCTIVIDP